MDLLETYPRRLALFMALAAVLLVALRGPVSYLNYWRGEQEIMANRRGWALTEYARGLILTPKDPELLVSAAYLYASRGATEQAIADYRRAIRVAPELSEPRYLLGLLLQKSGDSTGASEVLTDATRHTPGEKNLWLLLATVYRKQGRISDAVATWREIANRFPESGVEAAGNIRSLEGTSR